MPDDGTPISPAKIAISSFDELIKHQNEIIARIDRLSNGRALFMTHPFLLLADVGVELSDVAKQQILQNQPEISGLSAAPYEALKRTKAKQSVTYKLKGLFRRSSR
jgi:hypothetical protein